MIGVFALHEGYALPLDGVGDDHAGRTPMRLRIAHGVIEGAHVMTVAALRIPAEALPFFLKISQGHHLVAGAVELYAVAVHDGNQVVCAEFGGGHGRFPHGALIELAIAGDGIYARTAAADTKRQRHAQRRGKTHPQRPGGQLNARQLAGARMPLQPGAELTQRIHFSQGKEAFFRQNAVQHRGGVALGEHHAVAVGVLPVVGRDIGALKIQHGQDFAYGQRSAGVPRAHLVQRGQNVDAKAPAKRLQRFGACFVPYRRLIHALLPPFWRQSASAAATMSAVPRWQYS